MKKNNLFIALACFGLLITGCNKPASSSENKPASSSGNASTQSQPSSQSNNPSTSSTPAVVETFYEVPFGDANSALNGSDGKWGKGAEYSWTFNVPKNYKKVQFAVGAKMSSSSHSDRSLYTNHEGASSNDSFESNEANDGTCRITVKANGVEQTVAQTSYGEAELNTDEFTYYRVSEFAVNAGELVVTLKTNASTGYRLMLGEGARLYYNAADESATPTVVPQPEGYNVTFVTSHCKVLFYEGQDYSVAPVEGTKTVATDDEGKITKYIAADATTGQAEVKPQVNFKVVCDEGYAVDQTCITPSGTKGTEWNNVKLVNAEEGIFRITVIKADITVTINAVDPDTLKEAFEIKFELENCSAVVYIGKKADNGGVDVGPKFFSRDKTDPTKLQKGNDAQFNFDIVVAEGFEWVDPTVYSSKGEAGASDVSFIKGSFNKLKKLEDGSYNITQVNSDLTITIKATAKAA